MQKEIALKVENISKTFNIPREKIRSIRSAFVKIFNEKTYEEFEALKDISFEVKKGEFFGIIGRNGSGKSTLLKILAGIYQPDKGKIKINGMISPFLELGIGFNPELSGRDNIYLNATVLGMTKKQIDAKFDAIVAFSELERFIDQKLVHYSSGMQVRLAFSVAIHANRDILLMDEVLAVGDSRFKEKCLDIFRQFKKNGKTILFVSHDADMINDFCDRVVVINKGSVAIIDKPEKAIYEYSKIIMGPDDSKINADKKTGKFEIEKDGYSDKKINYYLGIKILNGNGEESNVFESGEDIIIEFDLKVGKVEEGMYLSIGIFDKITDSFILGNNMFYEKVYKDWKNGLNKVRIIMKNSYFNKGDFYISSNFFKGDPKEKNLFDYYNGKDQDRYFKVIPKNFNQGLTRMPHEWDV